MRQAWLATLQGLPQLTRPVLGAAGVEPEELQQLSALSSLREVHLSEVHDMRVASSSLGAFPLCLCMHAMTSSMQRCWQAWAGARA